MSDHDAGAGEPLTVVRRAPFSDNPLVGARGLRTQQQILDAALKAFGEVGYHRASIERIAKDAGCSRIAFYQYFSDKADVFRLLAEQVDRQVNASIDRLAPVTPDEAGWSALRDWVGQYAEIRARYEAVFRAFPAAAESDAILAGASVRKGGRYVSAIHSRVTGSPLPPRELEPVIELCVETLPRTLEDLTTLRSAAPDAFPPDRLLDAFVDVMHRALFGLQPETNVHAGAETRPPRLAFGPVMLAAIEHESGADAPPASSGPAYEQLLAAGRRVFVSHGYHGTRVDDIVVDAGVSHGAFYRYFKNKAHLAHVLAAQAMRTVSVTLIEMPEPGQGGPASHAALRRWLRNYNVAQVSETAMIRVWADAAHDDDGLVADTASVLDWGRRRMAHFLRPRGFGDADSEAVVLLALIDAIGVRERSARTIDAALHLIETGFLGQTKASP